MMVTSCCRVTWCSSSRADVYRLCTRLVDRAVLTSTRRLLSRPGSLHADQSTMSTKLTTTMKIVHDPRGTTVNTLRIGVTAADCRRHWSQTQHTRRPYSLDVATSDQFSRLVTWHQNRQQAGCRVRWGRSRSFKVIETGIIANSSNFGPIVDRFRYNFGRLWFIITFEYACVVTACTYSRPIMAL